MAYSKSLKSARRSSANVSVFAPASLVISCLIQWGPAIGFVLLAMVARTRILFFVGEKRMDKTSEELAADLRKVVRQNAMLEAATIVAEMAQSRPKYSSDSEMAILMFARDVVDRLKEKAGV